MAKPRVSGRHEAPLNRPERRPRPGVVAAIIVAAIVLLGGGTVWAASTQAPPDPQAAAASSEAQVAARAKARLKVPRPVLDCLEQVRAGDAAVSAAYISYKDWNAHVKAENDLDDGKIDLSQANAIWDRGHARGNGDMNAFDARRIVYDRQAKACGKLPADLPSSYEGPAQKCVKRATAISAAVDAGHKVSDDWADHVIVHRTKQQTDPATYHAAWIGLVKKAPKHLNAFRKAYAAYRKAPSCSVPRVS